MTELKCRCGRKITSLQKKLNSGLCDKCLQARLRVIAREIAKRKPS